MKKTKILLPFLGIGAIATTTGVMASCSCNDKIDFVLSELADIPGIEMLKFEHVNLKKQTVYNIKCDLTKIKNISNYITTFGVVNALPGGEQPSLFYDINTATVLVDGKELEYKEFQSLEDLKQLQKNQYCVCPSEGEGGRSVAIGRETLNNDSELIIKIQVSTDIDSGCLIFAPNGI